MNDKMDFLETKKYMKNKISAWLEAGERKARKEPQNLQACLCHFNAW